MNPDEILNQIDILSAQSAQMGHQDPVLISQLAGLISQAHQLGISGPSMLPGAGGRSASPDPATPLPGTNFAGPVAPSSSPNQPAVPNFSGVPRPANPYGISPGIPNQPVAPSQNFPNPLETIQGLQNPFVPPGTIPIQPGDIPNIPRPGNAFGAPASATPTPGVPGVTENLVQGPTVGSLANPASNQPATLADLQQRQLQAAQAAQAARGPGGASATGQPVPGQFGTQNIGGLQLIQTPGGDTIIRQPMQTIMGILQSQGRTDVIEAVQNGFQQSEGLIQEAQLAQTRAQRLRSGEEEIPQSGITDMLLPVTGKKQAQAAIEAGKIPIPMQDVQLILDTARQQGEALMQAANNNAELAKRMARMESANFLGQSIGSTLGTLISGVPQGQENLAGFRDRALASRENFAGALRDVGAARVESQRLEGRAKIDAMLAEMEPMKVIADTLLQEAREHFINTRAEIQREEDRATNLILQAQNIRGNAIGHSIALATPRGGGVTVLNDQRGTSQERAFQRQREDAFLTLADHRRNLAQATRDFKTVVESQGINTREAEVEEALSRLIATHQQFRSFVGKNEEDFRKMTGQLLPPNLKAQLDRFESEFGPAMQRLQASGAVGEEGIDIDQADPWWHMAGGKGYKAIFNENRLKTFEEVADSIDVTEQELQQRRLQVPGVAFGSGGAFPYNATPPGAPDVNAQDTRSSRASAAIQKLF